jgi:hypothetical protein
VSLPVSGLPALKASRPSNIESKIEAFKTAFDLGLQTQTLDLGS